MSGQEDWELLMRFIVKIYLRLMAQVQCAICREYGDSYKMLWCDRDNLWVHYTCAGGGNWASAKCPRCGKRLG
jgi:hypothetical protein